MSPAVTRRSVLLIAPAVGAMLVDSKLGRAAHAAERKFTVDLCPGRIGVSVGQDEAIQLAKKYGYESVEPFGSHLAGLGERAKEVAALVQEQGLVWGAAGMPTDFRGDEAKFKSDLKQLPAICKGLQLAGVTRVGTWLRPYHAELSYLANFKQHASRLRQIAKVLGDYGLRFGLEYVGPRTMWSSSRYSFVHSMVETRELIAEIGCDNVGLVLDSWHWYTAEEDEAALLSLTNDDVVAVDLNDAPAGIDVRKQIDNRRELPAATGVIDIKTFLRALVKIGYDGPVRAEPFNQPLNALDNEAASKQTADAIRKAFSTLG